MKDPILTVLPADALEVLPAEASDDLPDVLPAETPVREELTSNQPPALRRGVLRRIWDGGGSLAEWLFGAAALVIGLAVLAALPVFQFLSLGYLLEAGGRVARTGRLRDGFVGVRKAARLGSIVLGTWLMLLPLRLVASVTRAAQVIDPDGPAARGWQIGVTLLTVLIGLHIVVACSRGGKLRYFLWPFTNPFWLVRRLWRGGYYTEARDAVWEFVVALRLPYYFWLGLRGFAGALLWLAPPVTLLALGRQAPLLGLLGALTLGVVVLYVPFLQARFATTNRFRAFLEPRAIRASFRRAPWAYGWAFLWTLALAVPLYLLKIEMIPREVAWLPSLFFVVFIYPARLMTGWAYGRGVRRQAPRHWFFRLTARLGMLPVAAFYVLIVFLAQYTSWEGIASLYEQHAFLLPVPFMGM
jgi:hypothetical protein